MVIETFLIPGLELLLHVVLYDTMLFFPSSTSYRDGIRVVVLVSTVVDRKLAGIIYIAALLSHHDPRDQTDNKKLDLWKVPSQTIKERRKKRKRKEREKKTLRLSSEVH